VSRPVWASQKDSLLGSKQGTSWVPGTNQGPIEFLGKATRPHVVFGPVASNRETDARTRPVSVHKVLRFCQAGHCGPSRQARTIRHSPWERPGNKQGPLGSWQQEGAHMGSLVKAT
jgi:hypothetical protein